MNSNDVDIFIRWLRKNTWNHKCLHWLGTCSTFVELEDGTSVTETIWVHLATLSHATADQFEIFAGVSGCVHDVEALVAGVPRHTIADLVVGPHQAWEKIDCGYYHHI